MKEEHPLKWPTGWPRVLPEKQQLNAQWKKSWRFYRDQLEIELARLGVETSMITLNADGSRDPGVGLWFSRKKEEDFSWRDTLAITTAYPTLDDVNAAYRRMVAKYHTDNLDTGDLEIFHKISRAKAAAINWVNHSEGNTYDFGMGSDKFKEPRLNLAALANSIRHIRGLERCGTSAIMEKTLQGFAALPEGENVKARA